MTYEAIKKDLSKKIYHPIYFLYGDESFFIDEILNQLENEVLNESEKAFNQMIFYGRDTQVSAVVETARRLPMMANFQVVIVKEAQNMKKIDDLGVYVENPSKSTILILVFKHKKPDKRKKFFKLLLKKSVVFESKSLYDNQVPAWIKKYLASYKMKISEGASLLLTEYLGTDLSKVANELQKLILNKKESGEINEDDVEKYIGISKEFNVYELQNALSSRDSLKSYKIVNYMIANTKSNPFVVVVGSLFAFFTKVYLLQHGFRGSDYQIASDIGVIPRFVPQYKATASNYSVEKVEHILQLMQVYDLKVKGLGNSNVKEGELLKEVVASILN